MSHISLESGICLQSLLVTNDYMICLSWYPFLMTLLSKNPEYIRHKFPAITQNMLTPPHWGKSICLSKAYPFCFCTPVTLHLLLLTFSLLSSTSILETPISVESPSALLLFSVYCCPTYQNQNKTCTHILWLFNLLYHFYFTLTNKPIELSNLLVSIIIFILMIKEPRH